jgi:hypothetical protein
MFEGVPPGTGYPEDPEARPGFVRAFVVTWLLVQIAYPVYFLWLSIGQGIPVRFGWQMFARLALR